MHNKPTPFRRGELSSLFLSTVTTHFRTRAHDTYLYVQMSSTPQTRSSAPIDLTVDDLNDDDSDDYAVGDLESDAHGRNRLYTPSSTSDVLSKPSNDQLVRDIFREVWGQFVSWKVNNNRILMRSLQDPHEFSISGHSDPLVPHDDDSSPLSSDTDDVDPNDSDVSDTPSAPRVHFDDATPKINLVSKSVGADGSTTVTLLPARTITLPFDTSNDPSFEAFQPANVCIGVDIPANRDYVPPFIPYADEPEFNQKEYLEQYKDLGWQDGNRNDPDRTLVHLLLF